MTTPEHSKQHAPKLALTREEAGEALGVSAITVDRLAKRGLLRPSRATRRPLYPVFEIERFLRETSREITL
jgi:predicted site-specific integrase-resolvase